MKEIKFRLVKDGKIVGYERYTYCDQREDYLKGKSLVPQHSKDGVHWDYIYSWEMKTRPKGYWFEAHIDMDVYIEHDKKGQFTGLKDKNGKEIYFDSDTVEYTYTDCENEEITVRGTVVLDLEYTLSIYVKTAGGALYHFTASELRNIEIIGEIHEKPELLNGVENER